MSKAKQQKPSIQTRQIVFALVSPIAEIDLVGPLTAFHWANILAQSKGNMLPYNIVIASTESGVKVSGECGLTLRAEKRIKDVTEPIDTLLVVGGNGSLQVKSKSPFVKWLRDNSLRMNRIASVCTGAFVLGAAGLLDGRRATTHWAVCADLAMCYPKAQVEEAPIFVRDGNIYTSAGVTAGMDLALELIQQDLGSATVLDIARNMVLFLQRPGGQAQFSASLAAQIPERQNLRELQTWITENLSEPLTVDQLAAQVAMSPRNFARVFARETKTTPSRYVLKQRIEAARRELEQTERSQDEIAVRCGFGTTDNFRRVFVKKIGITPGRYRSHFKQIKSQL